MAEGRKKKVMGGGGGVNPAETSLSAPTSPHLPIGDPFERILTTPKELLIQRTGSPRRTSASPLKSQGMAEVCLELLPKLSGKPEVA